LEGRAFHFVPGAFIFTNILSELPYLNKKDFTTSEWVKNKYPHRMHTVPQLMKIILRLQAREVDKVFRSGIMKVASVLSLFPNSLKEVSKQTRLNRYIGECCKIIS
jgi:hypothetical protein